MKLFLIPLMLLGTMAMARPGVFGTCEGQEGHGAVGPHGAEVFQTDDALRVFDAMEYPHEGFIPATLKEYQTLVKPALQTLKTKLPKLAEKMERMFERGINPRWYFVSYSLKPANDGGQSHLMLTYQREQIALNDDGIIQIQKKLWDKLPEIDRALLLVHEVIWSTAEDGGIQANSGDSVRKLSTLIFDSNLATFPADQVAEEVGRRARAICQDLESCPLYTLSHISFLNRPARGWEDISTGADDRTARSCGNDAHCVYSDEKSDLYWTSPQPGVVSRDSATWDDAQNACASLGHWGGVDGWRLPSTAELSEAASNGILEALASGPNWQSATHVFWANAISESNENFALVVDMLTGKSMRHRRTGGVPYLCVAGDFSKNWKDVSLSAAGAPTVCQRNSDHCAWVDRKSGLTWSERTPNYHEDELEKGVFSISWNNAVSACAQIEQWNGTGQWRLPTAKEFEAAYHHGLYRLALANSEGFGRANDTFWAMDWEAFPQLSLFSTAVQGGDFQFFDFYDGQVKREAFTNTARPEDHSLPQPATPTTDRAWLCVR